MSQLAFYTFAAFLLFGALGVILFRNPVHSVLSLIFCFFNAAGLMLLTGSEFVAILLLIVYVGAVAVLFLFVVMMMNISADQQRPLLSRDRFKASFRFLVKLSTYKILFLFVFSILLLLPVAVDLLLQPQSDIGFMARLFQSRWSLLSPNRDALMMVIMVPTAVLIARAVAARGAGGGFLDLAGRVFDSTLFVIITGVIFMVLLAMLGHSVSLTPLTDAGLGAPMPPEDTLTNTEAIGQLLYGPYVLLFQVCGLILLVAMVGAIVLTHRKRAGVKRQEVIDQVMRRPESTLRVVDVPLGKGVGHHDH